MFPKSILIYCIKYLGKNITKILTNLFRYNIYIDIGYKEFQEKQLYKWFVTDRAC